MTNTEILSLLNPRPTADFGFASVYYLPKALLPTGDKRLEGDIRQWRVGLDEGLRHVPRVRVQPSSSGGAAHRDLPAPKLSSSRSQVFVNTNLPITGAFKDRGACQAHVAARKSVGGA